MDDFPGDVYTLSASSPEIHTDLKKELNVDLPILSDKYLTLIEKVNLKDPEDRKALRGFAILDKDGNVIDSQQFDPFGEQISEIIQYAKEKVSQQ